MNILDERIRKGDIFVAEYFFEGSWRKKPVVVVQNDIGNQLSPLLIVVPIISDEQSTYREDPMQLNLDDSVMAQTGLKTSVVLLNVILTINKNSLIEKVGYLPPYLVEKLDRGLVLSLGIKLRLP